MTRQRTTQLVTLLVVAGGLGLVLARRAKPPAEPADTVYAMLAAARAGDVKAYLACYTGPMREALQQTMRESTTPGFAKYLRDTHAAVKGLAVSDAQQSGDLETTLRVEYIYPDRNEAQTLSLEKGPDGWKIARIDVAGRVPTKIPYGTPDK